MEVDSAPSAARRRRERRLRQFMRHDRLTVAMALAEFGEDGQGQVGGERDEQRHGPADSSPRAASMVYFRMDDDGGCDWRPADTLAEVRPQPGVQRHTVERIVDFVRFVQMEQIIDALVPRGRTSWWNSCGIWTF